MDIIVFTIIIILISVIFYISDLNGKTKISHFIFSFSNCKEKDYIRKLFLTCFLLCIFYSLFSVHLIKHGFKSKEHKLDFMGNGDPILFNYFATWQISHRSKDKRRLSFFRLIRITF